MADNGGKKPNANAKAKGSGGGGEFVLLFRLSVFGFLFDFILLLA